MQYFVVLSFQLGKSGVLVADQPQEIHGGAARCVSAAKRMAAERAGVIAFSRSGDPQMGDWDDAEILWQYGIVPEDLFGAVA